SSIPVPLSATLHRPGSHSLRVTASGWANGSFVQFGYPVVLTVAERPSPVLTADPVTVVVGERASVNVTVADPADNAPGALLTLRHADRDTVLGRRIIGDSASRDGNPKHVEFPVRFSSPGRYPLTVDYRSVAADGHQRAANQGVEVSVEPAEVDLTLSAAPTDTPGPSSLTVLLENDGNVPVADLRVRTVWETSHEDTRFLTDLSSDGRRRVEVPLPGGLTGNQTATVSALYTARGTTHRTTTRVTVRKRQGRILLTGVTVDRDGSRWTVRGHASNVGLEPVQSVILRPVETIGLRSTDPQGGYFVGSVPASDFVPFEVTVRASRNVTTIPIRVSGLRAGVPTDRVHQVPVGVVPDPRHSDQSRTLPELQIVLGGIVTVGVGGLMGLAWRNRDHGD
ncbi:MAG: hypothetical protein R3324_13195, partial [Halobacteriales archaeon]|nr:hypothetical protein [Halobacteriales archaeon]